MVYQQPPTKPLNRKKMKGMGICTVVQITVLIWSGAILTAGWIGMFTHADTTFTAGIFTSILANFGVQSRRRDDTEPDYNQDKPAAKPKVKPIDPPTQI